MRIDLFSRQPRDSCKPGPSKEDGAKKRAKRKLFKKKAGMDEDYSMDANHGQSQWSAIQARKRKRKSISEEVEGVNKLLKKSRYRQFDFIDRSLSTL